MAVILVVDGEEVVVRTVERTLQGEYQVHVAYNGADAQLQQLPVEHPSDDCPADTSGV